MKKAMALLLAMTLCLAAIGSAIAEDDYLSINPEFLAVFNKTPVEWYVTETNRSAFTATTIISILLTEGIPDQYSDIIGEAFRNNTVYVGLVSQQIIVAEFFGDHSMFYFLYSPSEGAEGAKLYTGQSSASAEAWMMFQESEGLLVAYSKANLSEVYEYLSTIVE